MQVPSVLRYLLLTATLGLGRADLPLPFHLSFTPDQVTAGVTTDVALRCESNASTVDSTLLRRVSGIRILKKISSDGWQILVRQRESGQPEIVEGAPISASGRVIPPAVSATFLEIRWPRAEEDIFGVYKCDVSGMDSDNTPRVELTSEVRLQKADIPAEDIVDMLLKTKRDIENAIMENSREIETLTKLKSSSQQHQQQGIIDLNEASLGREFLLRNTTIAWPKGEYALLQPDSGCPVDLAFFGGNSGYFRIHTESTDGTNANNLHREHHLSQPVLTQSGSKFYLYLRFCVVTRVFSETAWPGGAFCVHTKGAGCPPPFAQGKIFIDTEDHQNSDQYGGNVPFTTPTELLFCCRKDADPRSPIHLPTESPFYLYRYGGSCQQVHGMEVTPEFIEIDTENYINHDRTEGAVPDSDLEMGSLVRVELCYYSKKK